jgi:hypothetical protein
MSTVAVNKDVLLWALARSRHRAQDVLPEFPKIQEWIEGTKQPTLRQLEGFAQVTHTPLGYLFLPQPPEERLPIPHFRTARDKPPESPSPELLDTIHTMQ